MRVVAFLYFLSRKFNFTYFAVTTFPGERADLKLVALDCNDIEIVQIDSISGVSHDRADVAGEEVFILSDTENERTAATRTNNKIWNVSMDEGNTVRSDDLFQRRADGVDQPRFGICAIKLLIMTPDKMCQNFRIRFGGKLMVPFLQQLLFERLI